MAYARMQKPHTTIGAGGLNCRVRDGTGCTPAAHITNQTYALHNPYQQPAQQPDRRHHQGRNATITSRTQRTWYTKN